MASERAAKRVLDGVTTFVERRLKLKVNRDKSGIARATVRGLLGFGFVRGGGRVRVRLEQKTKVRLKARLRWLSSRRWRVAMAVCLAALNRFIGGWTAYFALAETPSVFAEFDEWLRRRLRQVRWKEWKRFAVRRRNLRALGIRDWQARQRVANRKGYWRPAGSAPLQRALPTRYWTDLGLVSISARVRRLWDLWRTPDADPHVRWCGRGG